MKANHSKDTNRISKELLNFNKLVIYQISFYDIYMLNGKYIKLPYSYYTENGNKKLNIMYEFRGRDVTSLSLLINYIIYHSHLFGIAHRQHIVN